MAIRKATSSGNWDGGATHPFDALPVDGDTIHTNGFTVTITGHINLPTATLTNAAGTGISAGGSFALSGSWDITVAAMTASTVQLLYISGTTTNVFTGITCTGGSGSNSRCIIAGDIQTLTFNSCTFNGGSGSGATGLLLQGVVTDVTFSSCFCACGVSNVAFGVSSTTGAVTCTGFLSILQLSTSTGEAIFCGNSSATWTLTGSVTHRGSALTVYLPAGTMTYTVTSESIVGAIASVNAGYWTAAGSGVLTVTRSSGVLDLGNTGPALVRIVGANSRVTYTGDVICGNSVYGHAADHSVGGGTGFVKMYGTIYGPSDVTVLTGARCAAGASVTVQHLARHPTNYTNPTLVGRVLRFADSTNLTRTASGDLLLVPADSVGDPPAQTDVRNGTSYHFDTLTGSLIVPSPSYVSTGVATDNTVGTLLAGMTALELRQAIFHADDTANKLRVSETGGVALDTEGQAMVAAFNAMRSGNVFTAPALANAPGGLTEGQQIQVNSIEAKTNLITSSTRITIAADSGSSITLKCGDDYAGSTAKRIEITDADSSLYNLLRGETLTARAFGAGIRRDAVTGTFSRDTITHTAASGSIAAYTTIFVECSVGSDTPAGVTTYDIQITDASGRKHTPFSGQCTLIQDFRS